MYSGEQVVTSQSRSSDVLVIDKKKKECLKYHVREILYLFNLLTENKMYTHRKPILHVCVFALPVVSWRRANIIDYYIHKSLDNGNGNL